MWDGKRTRRLKLPRQLRMFDSLSDTVSSMAHRSRRTIGLQLVYLIEQGIEHERECRRNEPLRTERHPLSRTDVKEKSA